MTDEPEPIYFAQALRQPQQIGTELLFDLTRQLYTASAYSEDRSPNHQWYYRLACECERRGYKLQQVLKG